MATRVTPATPTSNTPITVADRVTNVNNNLINLQDLLPEPTTANYPLVSVTTGAGSSTATFKKLAQAGIDSVGLDADTLDGVQGNGYALTGHTHGGGSTAGEVTMWNASNAALPSNKTHFTAMIDRFPIGANNNFAYGATGGVQTHQHDIGSHDHTLAHTHNVDHNHGDDNDGDGLTGTETSDSVSRTSGGLSAARADHKHWIPKFEGSTGGSDTTKTGTDVGTAKTGNGTHLPPYFAITFMVQL